MYVSSENGNSKVGFISGGYHSMYGSGYLGWGHVAELIIFFMKIEGATTGAIRSASCLVFGING